MRPSTSLPPQDRPPGEVLARFADKCGLPVFEDLGAYWLRRSRHLYQSLPPQRELALAPRQVREVLRRRRALAMQYPSSTAEGVPGGLFVCKTQGYTLARLTKTRRARVRKGQESTELRRMDPDELLAQGFELNLEAMKRQRRFSPELGIPARWAQVVRAVRDCEEASVFGAFVDGRLASYALVCRDGAWLHCIGKMQRPEGLRRDTASALDAWMLCETAKDPTIEFLVNGIAEGTHGALIEYRRSLGFEVWPQRRVTQLHPAARLFARQGPARAAQLLARRLPRSRHLEALARLMAAAAYVPRERAGEGAGLAGP